MNRQVFFAGLIALFAFGSSLTPAEAQRYRAGPPVLGYVTVDIAGRYEPLSAPVRAGRKGGREVLVPRWGWTDCGFSCRGALKSHYGQNFWDDLQAENGAPDTNILNDLLGLR